MKILSIDIGYSKPAFVILNYENNKFLNIDIYHNIKFDVIDDSILYLKYFFSLNIDIVIIEKQHINKKNISLMSFIHGFYSALNVIVVFMSPIACLRPNKEKKSRSAKKSFSVDMLNNILYKQNINHKFKKKDSDICDSINICLLYLHNMISGSKSKFIDNFYIPIHKIRFKYF